MSLDIKINPDGSYTVSCAGQSVTIGPMAAPITNSIRRSKESPEGNPHGIHAIALIGELGEIQPILNYSSVETVDLDSDWMSGKKKRASIIQKITKQVDATEPLKISVELDVGESYGLDEISRRLKEELPEIPAAYFEILPKIERNE